MNPFRVLKVPHAVIGVVAIIALCLAGFGYLWSQSGGRVTAFSSPYQLSFTTDDVKNLAPVGEVRIAGVQVGEVASQEVVDGRAHVTLRLDEEIAPLHEGATVRVGLKSLIGQQFVEVVDGDGEPLDSGATLDEKQVIPAVDIDELYGTFDESTRESLSGALESLGPATKGRQEDVAKLASGLGDIGREGYTAVDAIAAQGEDLRRLLANFSTIMNSLDTGRGQIADVVSQAQQLTRVTASQREDLEATMRLLPQIMDSAESAMGEIDGLNEDLSPVASDLRASAPSLNEALANLPAATRSLERIVTPADETLTLAPDTLTRVPDVGERLQDTMPVLDSLLRDVNPMVEYMRPYGRDLGTFFGNFGAAIERTVENGVQPVHLATIVNTQSIRGNPLPIADIAPLTWNNPYPDPGGAATTKKWSGDYPRVEREDP